MRKILVTGAAGFIGSHLTEELALDPTNEVLAVDSLNDYYSPEIKLRNTDRFAQLGVDFRVEDLLVCDLNPLMEGINYVFHQAGQPGVRSSWGASFGHYLDNNVLLTQRLLEAARSSAQLKRFVYASSSSVYGDAAIYPTTELTLPQPQSPYGVSKLAAEHLVNLYGHNYRVPTVSLRYFTVYGPRQRPDMAFYRFLKAVESGVPIDVYGDGEQVRDFTYVGDIVEGNIRAAFGTQAAPGSIFNLSGGSSVSINAAIEQVAEISGEDIRVRYLARPAGDVYRTGGSSITARTTLGWSPTVKLKDGLLAEYVWMQGARSP